MCQELVGERQEEEMMSKRLGERGEAASGKGKRGATAQNGQTDGKGARARARERDRMCASDGQNRTEQNRTANGDRAQAKRVLH